jgi:hypothetical protein
MERSLYSLAKPKSLDRDCHLASAHRNTCLCSGLESVAHDWVTRESARRSISICTSTRRSKVFQRNREVILAEKQISLAREPYTGMLPVNSSSNSFRGNNERWPVVLKKQYANHFILIDHLLPCTHDETHPEDFGLPWSNKHTALNRFDTSHLQAVLWHHANVVPRRPCIPNTYES